jgi:hypothetical protein
MRSDYLGLYQDIPLDCGVDGRKTNLLFRNNNYQPLHVNMLNGHTTSFGRERSKPCAAEVLAQGLKQELSLCMEGRDRLRRRKRLPM